MLLSKFLDRTQSLHLRNGLENTGCYHRGVAAGLRKEHPLIRLLEHEKGRQGSEGVCFPDGTDMTWGSNRSLIFLCSDPCAKLGKRVRACEKAGAHHDYFIRVFKVSPDGCMNDCTYAPHAPVRRRSYPAFTGGETGQDPHSWMCYVWVGSSAGLSLGSGDPEMGPQEALGRARFPCGPAAGLTPQVPWPVGRAADTGTMRPALIYIPSHPAARGATRGSRRLDPA